MYKKILEPERSLYIMLPFSWHKTAAKTKQRAGDLDSPNFVKWELNNNLQAQERNSQQTNSSPVSHCQAAIYIYIYNALFSPEDGTETAISSTKADKSASAYILLTKCHHSRHCGHLSPFNGVGGWAVGGWVGGCGWVGGAGGWGENSVFYSSGSTSKSLSAPLRTAPNLIFYSSGSAAKPRLRPVADCHDLLFIWQFLWIFSNRANRIYSQPISSKISYRTIILF